MKKNTVIGVIFFWLMAFGVLFSYRASNGFCLGEFLLNQLGLKAWQNNEEQLGLRYITLYAIAFVWIGLWGAKKYLKDSHPKIVKRMLWIFFAFLLLIVPATTEFAKNTYYSFQDGIKAVEYHAKDSTCYVDTEGQKHKISGTIVLTNHSSEELNISIKIIDRENPVEDIILRNDKNQITYTLIPKQKKHLDFEFYIDQGKTIFHSRSTMGPEIELIEHS